MTQHRRSLILVTLAGVLLAGASCDFIEEKIRENRNPGAGGAPGGGGGPAPSPPVSAPVACASSAGCPAGLRCSTERGACDKPPGCAGGGVCPALCYGVCQGPDKPTEEPGTGASCQADSDCRLFSDYCTGCDCRSLGKDEKDPVCPGPGVQCIRDPCGDLQPFCAKGRCSLRSSRPVPPPPPPSTDPGACFGGLEGGPTSCKSPDVWKTYASNVCGQKGLGLRELSFDTECGGGNYRYAKYSCCPVDPPTPQKCASDDDCPKIRIACKVCPDGGASCPSSVCQGGQCVITAPPCSSPPAPTPPKP